METVTCYPGQLLDRWRKDNRDSDATPYIRRRDDDESSEYDPARADAEVAAMQERLALLQ